MPCTLSRRACQTFSITSPRRPGDGWCSLPESQNLPSTEQRRSLCGPISPTTAPMRHSMSATFSPNLLLGRVLRAVTLGRQSSGANNQEELSARSKSASRYGGATINRCDQQTRTVARSILPPEFVWRGRSQSATLAVLHQPLRSA